MSKKQRWPPLVEPSAHNILNQLAGGSHPLALGGCRLKGTKNWWRFRLPGAHRLLCRMPDLSVDRWKIMTHQDYDGLWYGKGKSLLTAVATPGRAPRRA